MMATIHIDDMMILMPDLVRVPTDQSHSRDFGSLARSLRYWYPSTLMEERRNKSFEVDQQGDASGSSYTCV
jgi:hypothetical protein